MFQRTVNLDLPCSPAQAFEHIAVEFFQNHPRWDEDIVELTKTSSAPIGLGTTGREVRDVSGRRFVTDFRITEFRPDEAFSHRSTAGPMAEDVDYLIQPATVGTRLTLTVNIYPRTLVMRALAPMIRPGVERNFTRNIVRFEQMLTSLAA